MEMPSTLVEPFAAPEIYCEGFTDYEVKDGVLTFSGYRTRDVHGEALREVVIKIVMPVANLVSVVAEATAAAKGLPIAPEPVLYKLSS